MKRFLPTTLPLFVGLAALLLLAPLPLAATHNLAGQITARQNDPNNPNSYEITLTTYTDPAPAGVDRCAADFEIWTVGPTPVKLATINDIARSNGPVQLNPPSDCSVTSPRAGVVVKGTVKKNLYVFTYVFPGPGEYEIYYYDIARHGSVINIFNPEEQAFFVRTRLFITPAIIGSNNTPLLFNDPLDDACSGKLWTHNPGGFDPDGDSLAYSLEPSYHYDPAQNFLPVVASGYQWPDDPAFGASSFTIDPLTGVVTWDVPVQLGIYNFGIRIEEWRNGQLLGYVLRDIAVWVIDCQNNPPVIETISDTCIYAGETLAFDYKAWDPDRSDSLYLQLNNAGIGNNGPFSTPNPPSIRGRVVDSLPGNSFNYVGLPVSTVNNGFPPVDTIKGTITWATTCDNIRKQFYQVDLYANDNRRYAQPNVSGTTLAANAAVIIRVIPPPPDSLSASKGSRAVTLQWKPTSCGDAVVGYNIYRFIGNSSWMPDTVCCEMSPLDAGFELISYQQGWLSTQFVDSLRNVSGLLENRICYVVTAMYDVAGLEGFPVLESCATPSVCIEIRNEPIFLTRDSVSATGPQGAIRLRWTRPEIDPFFPQPFSYRLYRAHNNSYPAIRIADQPYADTAYLDSGLNTAIRGYNYRVEVFDALGLLVNTSEDTHIGSSIFLVAQGGSNQNIELSWNEFVPWRNSNYEVWRSENGGPWLKIADVAGSGASQHSYSDQGLNPATEYCYFIRSTGAYTEPGIESPLINDSQVACDFARDDQAPCNPDLSANGDCQAVGHRVRIAKSGLGCDLDASLLTLYFGDTESLGAVVATLPYSSFGQDTVLQFDLSAIPDRYSGCYRITATDTLGNTSAPSAPACLDFCPVLELPDVFTPNGDAINDLFRPILYRDVALKEVVIYDRWGRIMHRGSSEGFARLWDGIQDSNEKTAPEGTYFYYIRYEELGLSGNTPRTLRGPITLLR